MRGTARCRGPLGRVACSVADRPGAQDANILGMLLVVLVVQYACIYGIQCLSKDYDLSELTTRQMADAIRELGGVLGTLNSSIR